MTIQAANRKLKKRARPDHIMAAIRALSDASDDLFAAAETQVFTASATDRLIRDANTCRAAARLLYEARVDRMSQ